MNQPVFPRIVIKLGGSLITEKSKLCTPRIDVISDVADAISELRARGIVVIIVHGAGSFGHIKAKSWKLDRGRDDSVEGGYGIESQDQAVIAVRRDLDSLNEMLISELNIRGVGAKVHPPRDWATGFGENFEGDISRFDVTIDDDVPITFGDVVPCRKPIDFGILSGDDIIYRIAIGLNDISKMIFAMGDVDGLLSKPPNEDSHELIKTWKTSDVFDGVHNQDFDITGGIFLKVSRAAKAAELGLDVLFIRGTRERIIAAGSGEECVCTKIIT